MVYCVECGAENEDDALNCSNCGALLKASRPEKRGWEDELETRAEEFGKRMEAQCFGLPHGGAIAGTVFGLMIILFGLSLLMGIDLENFWAIFIVIFGVLIVVGVVYGFRRR